MKKQNNKLKKLLDKDSTYASQLYHLNKAYLSRGKELAKVNTLLLNLKDNSKMIDKELIEINSMIKDLEARRMINEKEIIKLRKERA